MRSNRMTINRMTLTVTMLVAVGALLAADWAPAQDLHPSRRPSPMGMARTFIGADHDIYVRVVYSRPYERGRDNIFGTEESEALVPWDQVWRTGANEAPEITVTGDVSVAGQSLPEGTYTLLTTPGEKEWKIHINSELGLNGTFRRNPETGDFEPAYDPENNVVDATVPVKTMPEDDKVEQFTISFEEPEEGEGTHMVFRWIRTEVRVPITPAD